MWFAFVALAVSCTPIDPDRPAGYHGQDRY
jgi:hypothetical protein